MSTVDRLKGAVARDVEASGQFVAQFWLQSIFITERRIEAMLALAAGSAESLDGSRAGAGFPPALLFALGLRRDAFDEQYRAFVELAWTSARAAAQQRAAFARAAFEGIRVLNSMALAGMAAPYGFEAGEPVDGARRRARHSRPEPASQSPQSPQPPRKVRPPIVLRPVRSTQPAARRRDDNDALPGSPIEKAVSAAGGRRSG